MLRLRMKQMHTCSDVTVTAHAFMSPSRMLEGSSESSVSRSDMEAAAR